MSFGQDEKQNPSSQTAFKEGVKLNFSFGTNKLLEDCVCCHELIQQASHRTTKPPVQSLSMIYYTQFDQVSVLQQHLSSFITKVKKKLETSLTCCLHLLAQLSRIAVPVDDILRLVCSGAQSTSYLASEEVHAFVRPTWLQHPYQWGITPMKLHQ